MLVVADASVLVVALQRLDDEGLRLRRWLVDLSEGQELQILQNLTQLEVMSALRRLVLNGSVVESEAHAAIVRFMELPARRLQVTQPMAIRVWELRNNLTPYDAAYVALTERLQSEEKAEVALATADRRLANAPGLSCDVRLFENE